MAFLDNLGKKLSEVGQTVKEKSGELLEKSGELIEINKIKAEIRGENGKMNKLFTEIGKLAYSIHGADGDYAGLLPLMEQINEIKEKIEDLKHQIDQIKADNPDIEVDAVEDLDEE